MKFDDEKKYVFDYNRFRKDAKAHGNKKDNTLLSRQYKKIDKELDRIAVEPKGEFLGILKYAGMTYIVKSIWCREI